MSKRTLFLIFALFLIAFVLLMMALYQPQASKAIPQKAVVAKPFAQTILSFGNPEIATSSSASILNYSLPINISTGNNKATAVQLELQYDPLILTNVNVIPGPFFPKPEALLNQIDVKTGRISYAFGIGLNSQAVEGNGVIANITFSIRAGTPEETAIIFLPKTLVAAQGISESVLKEANVGQFTLGVNNSTPSAQ